MNSFERVTATVSFQKTDRVPVIPQIFAHAGILKGYHIIDYVKNGQIAAACQLEAFHHYGHDAVFGVLDLCIEPEAIGAMIEFPNNNYPSVIQPLFTVNTSFNTLSLPDISISGRVPHVLTALRILRTHLNDTAPVIGLVQGPMTLALQLMGTEQALYLAADNPDRFEQLLTYTTGLALQYGLSQLNAGAHLIMIFEPGGCPEVIPPTFFREFIAPKLTGLFASYKKAGSCANWLHIAGNVGSILHLYADIGADIANFDYCVTQEQACQKAQGVCLDGNITPIRFISSKPELITTESLQLLEYFADRGGFILSSGCEIPPESSPDNIMAMVQAASHYCQNIR